MMIWQGGGSTCVQLSSLLSVFPLDYVLKIQFVGRQCHQRSGTGRESHALGVKDRRTPQRDTAGG